MKAAPGIPDAALPAADRADRALRERHAALGSRQPASLTWDDYDALIDAIGVGLGGRPATSGFTYEHPERLQDPDTGVGKPYPVRLAYSDVGGDGEPVIAMGGLTNVSQRFDFLSLDAAPALRVIGMEFAGRGRSGWLAELSDYHLDSYVEQLRQLLDHLGIGSCTLLGSSLGGSTAIRFAARNPERVSPARAQRQRPLHSGGEAGQAGEGRWGRHYVFPSPGEVFRRTGAAQRYSGPAPDAVLLHTAHHRTRWSNEERGRVYRHDLRALLAYRAEAGSSLDLWDDWGEVKCPVLLIHGVQSDATTQETIARMRGTGGFSVIHVPRTGHTPALCDSPVIRGDRALGARRSVLRRGSGPAGLAMAGEGAVSR